jgi:hypothetical protein
MIKIKISNPLIKQIADAAERLTQKEMEMFLLKMNDTIKNNIKKQEAKEKKVKLIKEIKAKIGNKIKLTYYEKLTMLLGREPLKGGLKEHMKYNPKFKTEEAVCKDLFLMNIKTFPKDKSKAKKLGLI